MVERPPEQPLLAVNAMEAAVPVLGPTSTLAEAGAVFGDTGVDLLPVLEGERLVGAIGLRDLVVEGCGRGSDPATTTVRSLMDPEPLRFSPDMGAAEALDTLHAKGAGAALMMKGSQEFAGVVSIHGLYRLLSSPPQGPVPEYVRRVRGEPL